MRDRGFHRRRETHGLTFLRQRRGDALQRRQKSHVEHPVRFIEDQNAQIAEVEQLAVEKILEPAGSRNDKPGATTNRAELPAFAHSSNDARCLGQLLPAQQIVLFDDLHREFAGRHENERRDPGRVALEQSLHHGDQKRERFARSGLRRGENIFALKRLGNRGSLHRSRRRKTSRREPLLGIGGND